MEEEHVEIQCDCGEQLSLDSATDRAHCDCGATYVVTVTKLPAMKQV